MIGFIRRLAAGLSQKKIDYPFGGPLLDHPCRYNLGTAERSIIYGLTATPRDVLGALGA